MFKDLYNRAAGAVSAAASVLVTAKPALTQEELAQRAADQGFESGSDAGDASDNEQDIGARSKSLVKSKLSAKQQAATFTPAQLALLKKVPQLAPLPQLFETVEAVYGVMSSLVLENPRFWIDLEDRPRVEQVWSPNSEIDTFYMKSLSQELDDDAEKISMITQLITWNSTYSKEDAVFSSTTKFAKWVSRISSLCALQDNVLSHYVSPEDELYPFSLLPLEKLRYFQRELAEIMMLQRSFQAWLVNQDSTALNNRDWDEVEIFIGATQKLSEVSMMLCVAILSMKKDLERHSTMMTSVLQSPLMETSEFSSESLSVQQLEKRMAAHQKGIEDHTARIQALQGSEAPLYLEAGKVKLRNKLSVNERLAERLDKEQARLADELSDLAGQLDRCSPNARSIIQPQVEATRRSVQENAQQLSACHDAQESIQALLESLESAAGSHQYIQDEIADSKREISKHLEYMGEDQKELKQKNRLNAEKQDFQALSKKREALRQQAEENARIAWEVSYPKATAFISQRCLQAHALELLFPLNLQALSSEMSLVSLLSTENEAVKAHFLSQTKAKTVRQFTRVHLSATDAGFDVTYRDSENGQLSTFVISSERCSPTYVPPKAELFNVGDLMPKSVSELIAESYRDKAASAQIELSESTMHALNQLDAAPRTTETIKMTEEDLVKNTSIMSAISAALSMTTSKRQPESFCIRAMTKGEELALHALIRATEPDESLLIESFNQVEMRYYLQANSSVADAILRFEYQALFFRFFGTLLSNGKEEVSFFTPAQLEKISQGNWLFQLWCIQELVEKNVKFATPLHKVRVHAILKVLEKMFHHIHDLPKWVADFLNQMDDVEQKSQIEEMSEIAKIKLGFGLVIDLLRVLLLDLADYEPKTGDVEKDAANMLSFTNVAKMLADIQEQYAFPLSEHNPVITKLAIAFLLAQKDLIKGTNLEPRVLKQAMIDNTVQPTQKSAWRNLKSAGTALTGVKFKKEENNDVAAVSDQRLFVPSEDVIMLGIMLPKETESTLNDPRTIKFIEVMQLEMKPEELWLAEDFKVKHAEKLSMLDIEADEEDEQDEYQYMLLQHKKTRENQQLLDHKHEAVQMVDEILPTVDNAELSIALNEVKAVGVVLRELILKDLCAAQSDEPRIENAIFKRDAARGVKGWIDYISLVTDMKNAVLSQVGESNNKVLSQLQLQRLGHFYNLLGQIKALSLDAEALDFLNSQNKLVVQGFIAAINRFAAVTMILCIIVLAVKKEVELAQQNINNVSGQKSQKIDAAWESFNASVFFLNQYVQAKSLTALRLTSTIQFQLPGMKAQYIAAWLKSHKTLEQEATEAIADIMKTNVQTLTVELSFEGGIVIHLKRNVQHSLYALLVKPERLHPSCSEQHSAPSIQKVIEYYNKKITRWDALKPAGAEREVEQLNVASAVLTEDSLELQGLLSTLYFVAVQNAKLKGEIGSRIAKSLNEFSRDEFDINLKAFKVIYNNWIRPAAFESSVRLQELPEVMEIEVFTAQLVLTAAVVSLQNLKRKRDNQLFFDSHQLQFAIRGNGYLEVLNIEAIMENLTTSKHNQLPEKRVKNLLSIVHGLQANMSALPSMVRTFLANSSSSTVKDQALRLTGLQAIKLTFIFAVEFYHELFMALELIESRFGVMKNLFAHTMKAYFSFEEEHRHLVYCLARDFFESVHFMDRNFQINSHMLNNDTRTDVKKIIVGGSSIYVTPALVELDAPDVHVKKRLLSGSGSFFESIKVESKEAILLTSLLT